MAYNPYGYGYPSYPNMYSQPMQGQLEQLRQNQQGIIWVQGEAGAKSYMVAAGNTVPLWDSEKQTIYIKSCDASGMPSMRVIDYTERVQAQKQPEPAQTEFATKQDLATLAAKVDALTVTVKEAGHESSI